MELTVEKVGDVSVVLVHLAELDAQNTDDFKESMAPIAQETKKIVLDLRKLTFVDSSGCGAILSCLKSLNARAGELSICEPAPQVRSVFELIRLHRICPICATREEAIEALK